MAVNVKAEPRGKAELKQELILLRAKGLSFEKCAKRLGLSHTTCWTWAKELEQEISQARAVELEALQEQYYLAKEGRLKMLGALLKRLQAALRARDFAEVSDDRLLELLLKVWAELKAEYVPTGPQAGPVDKTGMKLDGEETLRQLESLLERYRAGQVDSKQAHLEGRILLDVLKARELIDLEARLRALETALELRPGDNHRRY